MDEEVDENYDRICELRQQVDNIQIIVCKLLIGKSFITKFAEKAVVIRVDPFCDMICSTKSGERIIKLSDIEEILND